ENRSRSPAHQGDYVREVLVGLHVSQFVTPLERSLIVHPGDGLDKVIDCLSSVPYGILPVTDNEGHLLGVVSLEEGHQAAQSPNLGSIIIGADLMRSDVTPLRPGDRLDRALELFVENDLLALPVVDGLPEQRVVGIARRSDISGTYLRHVHGAVSSKGDVDRP